MKTTATRAAEQNRRHPNILVFHTDGSSTVYPSMRSAATAIGLRSHGALRQWLAGIRPIPARWGVSSVHRVDLVAGGDA